MQTSFRRQSGISLIEILTVLVLLLIGIFALLSLFGPGFLINKRSEFETFAAQIARQEMDRAIATSANLPDMIVPIQPVPIVAAPGYAFQIALNMTPDDISDIKSLGPLNVDPYYYSNINRIRRVFGETVRIPAPSPTSAGQGSIYVVSFGPIYAVPWFQQADSVFVSGAPMARNAEDSSDPDTPQIYGNNQYAIDYGDESRTPKVAFQPAAYDREFILNYSYYDVGLMVQTIIDEVVKVPANFAGWIDTKGNNGRPLVPDSDTAARKFVRTPPVAGKYNWSTSDPYQYDILSQNEGSFGNVGVLVFNPLGRDYTENSTGGPQPLTARIDYDVLDWHIIREDRPMPVSGPYVVNMTLKFLKRLGEVEEDNREYIGLFRDSSIPTNNQKDFVIYDLTRGVEVPELDVNGNANWKVNYKDGVVTFSDVFGQANAAATFRFFYRAQGDWGLSVQKAANRYRSHPAAAAGDGPNVGLAEYYVPSAGGDPGDPTKMYFPLMEAGKTIVLRDLYYVDGNGVSHRVSNESYRIESNPATFQNLPISNGNRTLTWIDLKSKHQDAVRWDPSLAGSPAVGVQGISFRARVMWTNGGRVTQGGAGNDFTVRWLRIDRDTFLTRTGEQ